MRQRRSFQTIYTKCYGGFEELCSMDNRFVPFGLSLFSEESQNQDRTEMTADENAKLDKTSILSSTSSKPDSSSTCHKRSGMARTEGSGTLDILYRLR